MGKVTEPYWLAIFRPDGSELSVASVPYVRQTGEGPKDGLQRILGSDSMLRKFEAYTDEVGPVEDDDKVHLYKLGDGQRKNPEILTVDQIRRRFDVDLTTAFE